MTRWHRSPPTPSGHPGPLSTMDPIAPPSDATLLFDGSNMDAFVSTRDQQRLPLGDRGWMFSGSSWNR